MILEFAVAALCSFDSQLTALFTPLRPVLGTYAICTTQQSFNETLAAVAAEGVHVSAPEVTAAVDAFGAAGPYDRAALSRLYASRRPRVVRGWRRDGDRFEALTVISPYPDVELNRLIDGTLVLRWQAELRNLEFKMRGDEFRNSGF
jgi:hypothetical protein